MGAHQDDQIGPAKHFLLFISTEKCAPAARVSGNEHLSGEHQYRQLHRALLAAAECKVGCDGIRNLIFIAGGNLQVKQLWLRGGISYVESDGRGCTVITVQTDIGDLQVGVCNERCSEYQNETGAQQYAPHL